MFAENIKLKLSITLAKTGLQKMLSFPSLKLYPWNIYSKTALKATLQQDKVMFDGTCDPEVK